MPCRAGIFSKVFERRFDDEVNVFVKGIHWASPILGYGIDSGALQADSPVPSTGRFMIAVLGRRW